MAEPSCQDVQPGYVHSSPQMGAVGMGVLVGHRAGAVGAYMVGTGVGKITGVGKMTGWC